MKRMLALAVVLAAALTALTACGGHARTTAPDPCVAVTADDVAGATGTSMRIASIGNRQLPNSGAAVRACTYLSAAFRGNLMVRIEFRTGRAALDSFKASQTVEIVNLSPQNGPPPARSVEHIASLPGPAVEWGNELSFVDRAMVVTVAGEVNNQPDAALSRAVAPVVARQLAAARH